MTRKLLPTSAPKPIPPEFLEKFKRHGWRRVENIWGKSTVLAWTKVIGRKRMAEERRAFLAFERRERQTDRNLKGIRQAKTMAKARMMGLVPEQ